jgi:hypothetical protein
MLMLPGKNSALIAGNNRLPGFRSSPAFHGKKSPGFSGSRGLMTRKVLNDTTVLPV